MLRFAEVLRRESIRRADRGMGLHFRRALRDCDRRMALAGLVAASALLLPALAKAAPQDAKPESAAATAPAAGGSKVSPYTIANRQHMAASTGAPVHTPKHAHGQPPVKPKPVRAERH
jgi:hypothetical protein